MTIGPQGVIYHGRPLQGLLQVTVLPPDSMFLPVLPMNVRGKLMYGLCGRCLEEGKNQLCKHSDRERHLTSTWTTPEVVTALQLGYTIIRAHELLAYEKTAFLFRDFYLQLARMKLESEGFPRADMTPEEKEAYVRELNILMPGLDIDAQAVVKNPARRSFAKLVSNGLARPFQLLGQILASLK